MDQFGLFFTDDDHTNSTVEQNDTIDVLECALRKANDAKSTVTAHIIRMAILNETQLLLSRLEIDSQA